MALTSTSNFTDVQLTRINCVRMYLGVTYFSEICTPDGLSISPGILNRTRDQDEYKTTLTRPYQPKPNSQSWDLWERTILPKTRTNNRTLTQPLQQWTKHHSHAGTWKSYVHHSGNFYTRNNDDTTWSQYRKTGTQLHLLQDDLTTIPTSECTPTTVKTFSNNKKYCDIVTTK